MKTLARGMSVTIGIAMVLSACQADLTAAARQGDVAEVLTWLRHGTDPNAPKGFIDGMSPLHFAAAGGHLAVVRILLDHGANVNTPSNLSTPLFEAVTNGHVDVSALLLERGANVNVAAKNSLLTPLHNAVKWGYADIVKLLLDHGADMNARTSDGAETPIEYAMNDWYVVWTKAGTGYWDTVTLLIKRGATYTLHAVAAVGDLQRMRNLLENGVGVGARDRWGRTPLHWAAFGGQTEAARLLLATGADAAATDGCDQPVSNCAAASGQVEIGKLLLAHGAKATPSDLGMAAKAGHLEFVRFLVETGVDPRAVINRSGATPLHYCAASAWDVTNILSFLLDKGADVNARAMGVTPLMFAAQFGNVNALKCLLEHSANVNLRDDEGHTALYYAQNYSRSEPAAALIRKYGGRE